MNSHKQIYLSPPHMSGYEMEYIREAFAGNWIAPLGPNVIAFEQEICTYTGAKAAVAVSSGTAAIHLALRLIGVEIGDYVFCSTLTFIGSVNPVLYLGAIPVFIDSEPQSWNMSSQALESAFFWAVKKGKIPKAVIVVNLYGQSADMDPIIRICDQYGVPVIEDAAESLGATYKGKASGTLGKYGIFSFNGNKIITTSGGGMLLSTNPKDISKALFWATQSRDPAPHYEHNEMGYNYRMSNILAGIGRGQLKVLDERIKARRDIFSYYYQALKDIDGVKFMPEATYGRSTRWLTALIIDQKKLGVTPLEIIEDLSHENIESRPLWKPMHLQPLFRGTAYFPHGEESVSDQLFKSGLCLPSGSSLLEEDLERVVYCFKLRLLWE